MNRADLQKLATERVADARALLAAKRWSAAYYLAGYAVECGLKACIIVRLMRSDEFPEKKFTEQCWSHNLVQLRSLGGLDSQFDAHAAAAPDLLKNWNTVKDWTEACRYSLTAQDVAEGLYEAVTDKKTGVLTWIKRRW